MKPATLNHHGCMSQSLHNGRGHGDQEDFSGQVSDFQMSIWDLAVFDFQVQMPRAIKSESGDSGIKVFK